MFTGLSAFPLMPLRDDAIDEHAFGGLIRRLAAADVDSITALGSTGAYAYLSTTERARVVEIAKDNVGNSTLGVGVGALRTSDVLANVRNAQEAGADFLLLSPVSYQPLTDDDVFGLFQAVTDATDLPVILYDNPTTTHFTFSDELYGRVAGLRGVRSIKIPGVPANPEVARSRVQDLRSIVGPDVAIGISGDASAATGLIAGCDLWYSVIGGTLPAVAKVLTSATQANNAPQAIAESARLEPLWKLFAEFGSQRVVAAIAEHLQLVAPNSLPLPIRGLDEAARSRTVEVMETLALAESQQ